MCTILICYVPMCIIVYRYITNWLIDTTSPSREPKKPSFFDAKSGETHNDSNVVSYHLCMCPYGKYIYSYYF